MLPDHSQQLLRAARTGRVYKPPAPIEDDNEMKDEEEEHKEVQTGFLIKKYVKVARHLEATEPEYLAKRRKGLPSQYVPNGLASVAQPVLRETKVKKLDAEGNATVYKVLVPEGQAVAGEVQPTDAAIEAAPATAAPGTVVEGVGVVNAEGVVVVSDVAQQTPPRRRNPPSGKRKRGGPGRKKRVNFIEGAATGQGTPTSNVGGDHLEVPGVKQEGGSVEASDGDTPMADVGGDDEEGSGDDGSDDDDHDGEHASHPATPSRPATAPTSAPSIETTEIPTLDPTAPTMPPAITPEDVSQPAIKDEASVPPDAVPEEASAGSAKRDPSSSPDLPLSTVSHSRQNSLHQIPTSATTDEPEPMALDTTEPIQPQPEVSERVAAAPSTSTELEPAPVGASEPEIVPVAVAAPTSENPSAPPSEPDLMASLDRHLEKDNEDIAGS
ncbi:hypothetical protein DE146DRAFT_609553 [Phaeosphaeria sp. MPI-PUGE-AT-0046c]|nr:hypothetical protein DE146DRAFT_609553 [Phaeosphaeria sp. MPI-PUGE-AT-0046c]